MRGLDNAEGITAEEVASFAARDSIPILCPACGSIPKVVRSDRVSENKPHPWCHNTEWTCGNSATIKSEEPAEIIYNKRCSKAYDILVQIKSQEVSPSRAVRSWDRVLSTPEGKEEPK